MALKIVGVGPPERPRGACAFFSAIGGGLEVVPSADRSAEQQYR